MNTVDSDTNDPRQTNYKVNDVPSLAQPLISPVTLVGAVNRVGKGPTGGRHYILGDADDWFKVSLKEGQVVEMLVGIQKDADNDADLCVVSADASSVGCSVSTTERECVRVTKDGDYFISVNEFSSSSVYNLRISAPGLASACSTATSPASALVPNQLLAIPKRSAKALAVEAQPETLRTLRRASLSSMRGAGLAVDEATAGDVAPVDLIRLPSQSDGRQKALQRLQGGTDAEQARRRMLAAKPTEDLHPAAQAVQLFRLAKAVQKTGAYEAVEPNWIMELKGQPVGLFPSTDRYYPLQRWHYEQIRLPEAMQFIAALPQQPTKRPVVAVIDSGVMLDHPELRPQLSFEGRTFLTTVVPGDGDALGGDEGARKTGDTFHGTHVAGTVAASSFDAGNTSYGAGVAPMAQILPLRVFPVGRGASSLDVLEALKYAAGLTNRTGRVPVSKADVVNLSLGSSQSCPAAYQSTFDAVRAAGVLVVAAAGNEASNRAGSSRPIGSPANCSGVFAVTAMDALRGIAPYSNTGTQAAFAAPGGDLSASTTGLGVSDAIYSTYGAFNSQGVRVPHFLGLQGTSMATPHVAGVLALMRYVNPAITPDQVLSRLQAGALTDDLGSVGKDSVFGWGLVNARRAVESAYALSQGDGAAPAPTQLVASPSSLDFGSQLSEVQLIIRGSSGTSNEKVVGLSSPNSSVLTIRANNIDSLGQGEYALGLTRSALPTETKSYFTYVRVTMEGGRSFDIPVAYSVIAPVSAIAQSNVGAMYVILIDPDTGDVQKTVLASFANGQYNWSASGYTKPRVVVLAGTDLDNDDVLCQVGEVCGGFPVYSTFEQMTIPLTANRSDLSFVVSPLGGLEGAASTGSPSHKSLVNKRKTKP